MTLEATLYDALDSLAGGRVYRDRAPQTQTTLPHITFTGVGGQSINFVDSATLPSKRNARIQVNVWDTTRDAANALALQVENALRAYLSLQTTVLGAPVWLTVDDQELYGTMQDFSVWA